MTLSEIETILGELAARHPNLDEELLNTLLLSAGWEEKSIKEAKVLLKNPESRKNIFAKKVPTVTEVVSTVVVPQDVAPVVVIVPPIKKEENITFYQTDGTEEGELHTYPDVPKVKQDSIIPAPQKIDIIEKTKIEVAQPAYTSPIVPSTLPEVHEEPKKDAKIMVPVVPRSALFLEEESLIVHDEIKEKRESEKQAEIPNNLPLLPYESSPHIWSFLHYKNVFHKDTEPKNFEPKEPEPKEEIKVITVMPKDEAPIPAPVQIVEKIVYIKPKVEAVKVIKPEEEEINAEKIPLTKGDESLVFLAGVMLLVIILILGYMYSNGRL